MRLTGTSVVRGALITAVLATMPALAAGCGRRAASGPAWPGSVGRIEGGDWTKDGGESIDPVTRSEHVAAVEHAEPRPSDPAKVEAPVVKADDKAAKPAEGKSTTEPAKSDDLEIKEVPLNPDDVIIIGED